MPSTSRSLEIGGASLVYQTVDGSRRSDRLPFIFQHGMGGDADQPLGYVGDTPPSPVISLNARGHAPSSDIDPAAATFDTFADDVIALADHLGLARFVVGGISLGAGTALNLAVRYPHRVTGLVLCRPAWLDRPQAEYNRAAYTEIADLLDALPTRDAAAALTRTRHLPDSPAPSPRRRQLPARTAHPSSSSAEFRRPARLPRLQPDNSAEHLASRRRANPGHRPPRRPLPPVRDRRGPRRHHPRRPLRTVPSKDADPARFAADIQTALHDFLRRL